MAIGRVPGATGIQPSIVDAKGDLIAATAADSVSRLAAGSNNQVLMADSAQATGLKYANEATATLTTTGDILYASAANTPARLAIGSTDQVLKVSGGIPAWGAAPAASFVGCVAFLTNNQTIATGTNTAITFDGEIVDTDGFHSNTVNNTRITVPSGKGGKYYIYFTVGISNDSNSSERSVYIRKNGSTIYTCIQGSPTVTWWQQTGSIVQDLVATDYIELFVYHARGTNLAYYGDSSVTKATQLGLIYLGA